MGTDIFSSGAPSTGQRNALIKFPEGGSSSVTFALSPHKSALVFSDNKPYLLEEGTTFSSNDI